MCTTTRRSLRRSLPRLGTQTVLPPHSSWPPRLDGLPCSARRCAAQRAAATWPTPMPMHSQLKCRQPRVVWRARFREREMWRRQQQLHTLASGLPLSVLRQRRPDER